MQSTDMRLCWCCVARPSGEFGWCRLALADRPPLSGEMLYDVRGRRKNAKAQEKKLRTAAMSRDGERGMDFGGNACLIV